MAATYTWIVWSYWNFLCNLLSSNPLFFYFVKYFIWALLRWFLEHLSWIDKLFSFRPKNKWITLLVKLIKKCIKKTYPKPSLNGGWSGFTLVSSILKTHHKKFQLNRSRWEMAELIRIQRTCWWWWIPSKNLSLLGLGQRGIEKPTLSAGIRSVLHNLKKSEYSFLTHKYILIWL